MSKSINYGVDTMTLTKAQLVEMISGNNGFTKTRSVDVVEKLIEIIKKNLANGEDVMINAFGKFCVKN